MPRTVPFLIAPLLGLALLVLGGYMVLARTTRSWFESDLALRSGLAVASAKQGPVQSWSASPSRLRAILSDIARDKRVMGAGAYSPTGEFLASTWQFPKDIALVRDVRTLVDRLSTEREREAHSGPWTAERLRSALIRNLQGERLVILSNREPCIHERTPEGIRMQHPASGVLVNASELRRRERLSGSLSSREPLPWSERE